MTPPFFRQVHESFVTGTEAGAFFAHACSDVQKQFLLAAATAADGFAWPMQCRHIIDDMNAEERRHAARFLDTLKEHMDEPVSDEQVSRELAEAGIDMTEPNTRLHAMVDLARRDATIAAQAEAIRLLRSALQNVQLALSLHRDGKHIILSSHGLLSLEEVKYLVVDEALATTAPKEPSDAE